MTFIAHNSLEALFKEAISNSKLRTEFLKTLLDSDIYFLNEEKENLNIRLIELNGKRHLFFFTSEEQTKTLKMPHQTCFTLNTRALFRTALKDPSIEVLVLNPSSKYGKVFYREQVKSFLNLF